MVLTILILSELFLGAIVGFVLSDNKRGLSLEEIKISSIIFLLANAFVFWQNPDAKGIVFAHLAISWFVLTFGVLIGEAIKMRLIRSIVNTIHKKDIQLAINELVQMAAHSRFTRQDTDRAELITKRNQVQHMLHTLIEKSKGIQNEDFTQKLIYLNDLCESYVKLSFLMWDDMKNGHVNSELIEQWTKVGQSLTGVSWDTLNHAEEKTKEYLSKAFSIRVVKRALK
jgi:hypothetical protein